MNSFTHKLNLSQAKEKLLQQYLTSKNIQSTNSQELGLYSGWDVAEINSNRTYEVKFDLKSNETGNVAIEVYRFNGNKREDTGVNATTATHWCLFFNNDNNIYFIGVNKLKKLIKEHKYHNVVIGGDYNKTAMLLFEKNYFISECQQRKMIED